MKDLAAAAEALFESTRRAPEMSRRGLVGQSLEVAEEDRLAESIGESIDLLVDDPAELLSIQVVLGVVDRHRDFPPFPLAGVAPQRLHLRTHSEPVGYAVEPRTQRVPLSDRGGLASEQEKRGLERVLHVLGSTQDAS